MCGRPIAEYVGLRPKMYSIREASGNNIKNAKGVNKSVVKKHIRHEQYKEALFAKQTFRHGMDVLRSERHRINGQHLNKVSLSPFDSKRWITENGVDARAYGHKYVQLNSRGSHQLLKVEVALCQGAQPGVPRGQTPGVAH